MGLKSFDVPYSILGRPRWFGSWALFTLAVAPLSFRVLPNAEVAGALVSTLLRTLHLYGLFAGLALFAIAFASKQSRSLQVLPLVLALPV